MLNRVRGIYVTLLAPLLVGIILIAIDRGCFPSSPSRSPVARPTGQPNRPPTGEFPTPDATGNSFGKAKLILSKIAGPPGTDLVVNGSGFDAGEIVVIRFALTQEMGRPQANGQGKFAYRVRIPQDWRLSMGVIGAEGLASGRRAREENFQVTR